MMADGDTVIHEGMKSRDGFVGCMMYEVTQGPAL